MFLKEINLSEVYLCREEIDFRKDINGLALMVEDYLHENVLSGKLFVFINRKKDKIKVLYWDMTGFCIWKKRLEKAKFFWPEHLSMNRKITLSFQQFKYLLEGFDLRFWKPHPELKFEKVS